MHSEWLRSRTRRIGICLITGLFIALFVVCPVLADETVLQEDSVSQEESVVEEESVLEEDETVLDDGSVSPSAVAETYGNLSTVSIIGNVTIPTDQIRDAITIKPGIELTDDVIQQGANEIFAMGYFQSVAPSLSEFLGGIRLTYRVEELPTYRGVIFEGNTVYSSPELEEEVALEKGIAISRNVLDEAFQSLVDKYGEEGYIIGLRLGDPAITDDGLLSVVIEEGRIGSINVVGYEKTKPEVIWKEIRTKPGDLFNTAKLQEDARRIYNLRIFEDVAIIPEVQADSVDVDVSFEVIEQKTAYFDGAIAWSSAEGFGLELRLADDNFLGRAHRAHVAVEFSGKGRYYEIAYGAPKLGNTDLSLETSLYDTYRERESGGVDYVEKRKGGTLGIGKWLDLYTSIFGKLTIEDTRNEWTGAAPPGVTAGGKTHSISVDVARDTRDNFFDPRSGGEISGGVEYAGGLLGGDYNFVKYNFAVSRLISVGSTQVAGVRLLLGTSTGDLPSQELFRIGGTNTLRGYADYEFSGDKMIVVNAEYRFDIADKLQGVVFVDAGNAFGKGTSISLEGLKMSYGVGVRFTLVPGFTLRLDYGISPTGNRLHFSMGNLF